MKNLLALGAAALIAFAGIGWYLGWYRFSTTPTETGRHISIDLNTPKIKQDISTGKEKLRDYLSSDSKAPQVAPVPSTNQQSPGFQPTGFQRTDGGGFVVPGTGGTVVINPPTFPQR
ncbi:MAG: hypothetical protein NZO58_10305 [Gemmataceae bacterium]|nr:hypothetical protein [Gemmataceae bacterium]